MEGSFDFSVKRGDCLCDQLRKCGIDRRQIDRVMRNPSVLRELAALMRRRAVETLTADSVLGSIIASDRFFGPTDLVRYLDFEFTEDVNLPIGMKELTERLQSPCPIVRGKKIFETHYLCYVPRKFKDSPMSICQWQLMLGGYMYEGDKAWFESEPFFESQITRWEWMLFFDCQDSFLTGKNFETQLRMKHPEYEIPSPVECLPIHFYKYLKEGQYFNDGIFGRTSEYDKQGDRICVGGFDEKSLKIVTRDNFYQGQDITMFLAIPLA